MVAILILNLIDTHIFLYQILLILIINLLHDYYYIIIKKNNIFVFIDYLND